MVHSSYSVTSFVKPVVRIRARFPGRTFRPSSCRWPRCDWGWGRAQARSGTGSERETHLGSVAPFGLRGELLHDARPLRVRSTLSPQQRSSASTAPASQLLQPPTPPRRQQIIPPHGPTAAVCAASRSSLRVVEHALSPVQAEFSADCPDEAPERGECQRAVGSACDSTARVGNATTFCFSAAFSYSSRAGSLT